MGSIMKDYLRRCYPAVSIFQKQLTSLVEDFVSGIENTKAAVQLGVFQPKLDLIEGEAEYRVLVELAGFNDKDIEVTLTKNSLTIRGEKAEEHHLESSKVQKSERRFGAFERVLAFECSVDESNVQAKFQNGLLSIVLKKLESKTSEARKIAIEH